MRSEEEKKELEEAERPAEWSVRQHDGMSNFDKCSLQRDAGEEPSPHRFVGRI